MNNHRLALKQLNQPLQEWQRLSQKYGAPRVGWVKTLRTALNMSAKQLANRLGLTRSRIAQLENAEVHDAVTLRTLREVAEAMECELIYAIVPKGQSTLEEIIRKRAEQLAKERVERVAHSMSLEAQSLDGNILKQQQEDLVKIFMENISKEIWDASDSPDNGKHRDFVNTLAKSLYNEAQQSDQFKKFVKDSQKKK